MTVLDTHACSSLLHCSPDHLRRLCLSGEIPATKIGRDWIFIEEDVIHWLRTRSQTVKKGRPRKPIPKL